jgi:tRNA (mo5U34)-methyltransferase
MDASLQQRVQELRHKFHSPFDFGDGVVTKPWHVQRRFARRLRLLQVPDLTGKTVLDIGAWDGYFSFEFERRGAKRVLAIDVWDEGALQAFLLAREHFKSKVEYRRLDAHQLSPDLVGTFDVVFCAGVLYHLRHPLQGLESIRSVTSGRLILETASLVPALHEWVPYITFFPGDKDAGNYAWHHGGFPTKQWVIDALHTAGFARSEVIYTPSARYLKKAWALCTNTPGRGRLIVHAFV